MPPGQTVNQRSCHGVFARSRKGVVRVRVDIANTRILRRDDAPCHRALSVTRFSTSKNIPALPQLPYSPDTSLCDFFLFPRVKRVVKGTRFDKGNRYPNVRDSRDCRVKEFQKCYETRKKRWTRCAAVREEYFEGDHIDVP